MAFFLEALIGGLLPVDRRVPRGYAGHVEASAGPGPQRSVKVVERAEGRHVLHVGSRRDPLAERKRLSGVGSQDLVFPRQEAELILQDAVGRRHVHRPFLDLEMRARLVG